MHVHGGQVNELHRPNGCVVYLLICTGTIFTADSVGLLLTRSLHLWTLHRSLISCLVNLSELLGKPLRIILITPWSITILAYSCERYPLPLWFLQTVALGKVWMPTNERIECGELLATVEHIQQFHWPHQTHPTHLQTRKLCLALYTLQSAVHQTHILLFYKFQSVS